MVIKNKIKDALIVSIRRQKFIVTTLIVVLLTSMSVGYALYNEELKADGKLIVQSLNDFIIYSVNVYDSNDATDNGVTYKTTETDSDTVKLETDVSVTYEGNIFAGKRPSVTYVYQIANFTDRSYTYSDFVYESTINSGWVNINAPIITGLNIGDVLEPGDVINVYAEFYISSTINFGKTSDVHCEFIFSEGVASVIPGSLEVSVKDKEITLDDDIVSTEVSILNLYKSSVDYEIVSTNSDVLLVDESGNLHNYQNVINETETITDKIYLKLRDGVTVDDKIDTTLIVKTTNGSQYSFGTVSLIKEEEIVYGELEIEYDIEVDPSLPDTYNVTFKVVNNRAETAPRFTFYLYLNDSVDISKIVNPSASIIYDEKNNLLKVSSNIRGTVFSTSVASLATYTYGTIQITMNQSDLIIDKIELVEKTEIFTDGYDYTA